MAAEAVVAQAVQAQDNTPFLCLWNLLRLPPSTVVANLELVAMLRHLILAGTPPDSIATASSWNAASFCAWGFLIVQKSSVLSMKSSTVRMVAHAGQQSGSRSLPSFAHKGRKTTRLGTAFSCMYRRAILLLQKSPFRP